MYVNPNSTIILCKNVPLDNTYEHTIHWSYGEQTAQANYFRSKGVVTLNNQTYQRIERGKMRVQVNAESIYTCNYLMFQNTAYGSKWFYAFITGVEYVNDVTSEISFELDSLQTYWFDIELKPCYVEREHSRTDVVGENLVPEDIFSNPELCVQKSYHYYFGSQGWGITMNMRYSAFATVVTGASPVEFHENQVTPLTRSTLLDTQQQKDAFVDWVKQGVGYGCEMVNGFMIPEQFFTEQSPINLAAPVAHDIKRPTSFKNFLHPNDPTYNYTPKNNKLFTAPYTNMMVCSSTGNKAEYKWENTPNGWTNFNLYFNLYNRPSCELRPEQYYGDDSQRFNCVSIDEMPEVQVQQNQSLSPQNLLGSVKEMATIIRTSPNELTAGLAAAQEVGKIAFDKGDRSSSTSGPNLDVALGTFGFSFYVMGVRSQDAEIIDNYFSKYGYATKKVKVPNTLARQNWTYTKTKGCVIIGNAPADDVRKICKIFDNGITFWANANNVGNYGDMTNPVAVG